MTAVVDARGLSCPLPVLRANKTLRTMAAGETLTVLATDPASPNDFRAFCQTAGHQLLTVEEAGGLFTIALKKGPEKGPAEMP
jgi:tRNA 2-thiouridine synthesizing protein A